MRSLLGVLNRRLAEVGFFNRAPPVKYAFELTRILRIPLVAAFI